MLNFLHDKLEMLPGLSFEGWALQEFGWMEGEEYLVTVYGSEFGGQPNTPFDPSRADSHFHQKITGNRRQNDGISIPIKCDHLVCRGIELHGL